MFKFKLAPEGNDGSDGHAPLGQTPADDSPPANEAVVAEAKSLGWVEKERFKGREGEWIEADEFVRRGKEILPIVKENLRRVQDDLKKAKDEIASFGKTAEEFRKFTEEAAERKWSERFNQLKGQYARAVTDGEGEAAAELLEELEVHKGDKPRKETPNAASSTPQVDPEFINWRAANPWYENPELQDSAIAIGISINKRKGLVGKPLYAAVKEAMAKNFPDEVEGGEGNGGMFGDGGGNSSRRSNPSKSTAKTYENLPKDAKDACDRMLKKGFIKDKKQYVDNFDWS